MPPRFQRFRHVFGPDAFDWDETKNEANFRKRGIDLAAARAIFKGPILRRRDTRTKDETVYQAIGEIAGIVLMVANTTRNGRCRIISARKADAQEIKLYEQV